MLLMGAYACCLRLQALLENPDAQAADTAGLQLAAALGFAVYGFKEWKRLPLGELQPEKGGHHILCRTAIITERHVSATGDMWAAILAALVLRAVLNWCVCCHFLQDVLWVCLWRRWWQVSC